MKNTLETLAFFLLALVVTALVFAFGVVVILLQILRHFILDIKNLKAYFASVILGADSFAGSFVYGKRGEPFYLSSIAYYDATVNKKNIWFMHFINTLFFDKAHCVESFTNETKSKGIIPELNKKGNYKRWAV